MNSHASLISEIAGLRGAMAADDERLGNAEIKAFGERRWGCDAADKLADEILGLRKQLADLQHENEEQKSLLQAKYGNIRELPEYKKAKRYAENKNREAAELRKENERLERRQRLMSGQMGTGHDGTSAGENDENLRNAVLEEAADIADQHTTIEGIGQKIAYKIRLRKSKPTNKE